MSFFIQAARVTTHIPAAMSRRNVAAKIRGYWPASRFWHASLAPAHYLESLRICFF
jgi:hypothetical protein